MVLFYSMIYNKKNQYKKGEMPVAYEYFYGPESESFSFYRVPRLLVTGEEYRQVSVEAKLLYGMLLDRMGLSARNGWYDGENRVYIYYTIEEICRDFNCGHDKAGKLLTELDSRKGIGLIERVRQGQGRPARIYVKRFAKGEHLREAKTDEREGRGLDSGKAEVKASEKPKSRHRIFRGADIEKSDASYTDNSYTEFSYNNLSINQAEIDEKMEENLCTAISSIDLDEETPSMTEVRAGYRDLGFEHMAAVPDSMENNIKRIRNIKACPLRLLYQAPVNVGHFNLVPGGWHGDWG